MAEFFIRARFAETALVIRGRFAAAAVFVPDRNGLVHIFSAACHLAFERFRAGLIRGHEVGQRRHGLGLAHRSAQLRNKRGIDLVIRARDCKAIHRRLAAVAVRRCGGSMPRLTARA